MCEPTQDDDSFSSQPDDYFESSNEYQKLEASTSQEMEKIINQSSMSESLLYCLNGNNLTATSTSLVKTRKRPLETSMDDEGESTDSLKRPAIL